MSVDTASGAAPGPGEQPNPGPVAGMFASMLAPVDAARPTPSTATSVLAEDAPDAFTGASSADYHGDTDSGMPGVNSGSTSRQKQGIWRAWWLAGAERWRKGADARLKHLDMQKARHQATQIKEVRTVNRSEKILGGSSNTGSHTRNTDGKSLNNKTSRNDSKSGPLNSSGNGKNGSAGHDGRNGTAGSTDGGGRGRSGTAGGAGSRGQNGRSSSSGPDRQPRLRQESSKPGSSGGNGGRGKAGPQGPAGGTGKNASGGSSSGKSGSPAKGPRPDKTPGRDKVSLDKTGETCDAKKRPETKTDKLSAEKTPKNSADKAPTPGKGGTLGKTGTPGTTTTGKTDKTPATTPAPQVGATRLNTRGSRETGYRDGARAAKGAVHVQAYRHGFKDGWNDTQEAANREKTALDKAHKDRKKERDEGKPVAAPHSSADYHQPKPTEPPAPTGPQPIPVKSIDATHIHLGDGAARQFMSRGEVRSLKSFERRLEAKAATMTKVAESTRGLKAHATAQAQRATQLLEAAKSVKGGEKLVAHLSKLNDLATAQSAKAEEIHKRAVRGADACRAILANVKTRYGGIYQAVVDSPETAPAELAFYKG